MPGYTLGSIGWHGDDGKLFKDGQIVQQLPQFSTGDIVGIGVCANWVYFTLNNVLVFDLENGEFKDMLVCIAMRGPLTQIEIMTESNDL